MDAAAAAAVYQPEWVHQRLLWRIFLTLIHSVAILTSIFRVFRRYKTRQFGLDDYTVVLALILDLVFFPTLWLRNEEAGHAASDPSTLSAAASSTGSVGTKILSRTVQVALGWLVQVVYPLLTWSAKASLAITIGRLIPPSRPTHAASICLAFLSALIGIGILIQTCIYCSKVDKTWTSVVPYRCKVSAAAGIIRLGSELIMDACLTLIPFYAFFWPLPFSINPLRPKNPTSPVRLRLPPAVRLLLQVCFTASLLTFVTALLTMIILFKTERSQSQERRKRTGYMAFLLTHLTGSVSLLACNLLIVITSLYRFLRTKPRIVEVGKSPEVPNCGSAPIARPTVTVTARTRGSEAEAGSTLENSSSSMSGRASSLPTTRTLTSSDATTSYHVELTELFESDLYDTDPQRSTVARE